ncbi:ubiquitin family protein [Candidatus Woesearchaeota archaeon]|nr:ubiquitin family protein [Candidatus Woesearchaeota archaeon]
MNKKLTYAALGVAFVLVLVSVLYFVRIQPSSQAPDKMINLTVRVLQEETSGTRNVFFSTGVQSIDFDVEINLNDDVYYLKKLVYFKTKLPVEKQKITYKGQELEVGKSLYEYGINETSKVHIVLL